MVIDILLPLSVTFNYDIIILEIQKINLIQTVLDAWGKLPSGILYANQFDFGNFDECLGVNYNGNSSTFVGQYCLANINLKLPAEFAGEIPYYHLKGMRTSRLMSE